MGLPWRGGGVTVMGLVLHGHPFSSYCQKVLLALRENALAYEFRHVDLSDPAVVKTFGTLSAMGKMPVLEADGRVLCESTVIIEYLHLISTGSTLLPADPMKALDVRFLDRFFDNYVMTPMTRMVYANMRAPEERDPLAEPEARALLDKAYGWLEHHLEGREWVAGGPFSMADCAAAPALFYADWVHPAGPRFPLLAAYRQRLLARPSMMRTVDDARPYRHFFPPGAPDRD